jgi:hypothetical protein
MRWVQGVLLAMAVGFSFLETAPAWAQESPAREESAAVAEPAPGATALPYWLTLPPYSGTLDPAGPDVNCGAFDTWEEAQRFFLAAGGPVDDPHRLDQGGVPGIACEALRGTIVRNGVVVGTPPPGPQR